jgi:hypothetical protein
MPAYPSALMGLGEGLGITTTLQLVQLGVNITGSPTFVKLKMNENILKTTISLDSLHQNLFMRLSNRMTPNSCPTRYPPIRFRLMKYEARRRSIGENCRSDIPSGLLASHGVMR